MWVGKWVGITYGRSLSRATLWEIRNWACVDVRGPLGCVLLFLGHPLSEVVYFYSTLLSFKTPLLLGRGGEGREKPER